MISTLFLATAFHVGCAGPPSVTWEADRDTRPLLHRTATVPEAEDAAALQTKANELKAERELLSLRLDDLQRQLETAQQEIAGGKKSLSDVTARLAALEKERTQLAAALAEARDQARDLQTKLAAEQVKAATLREDKQKLMSGTTTAKEELARLQKRASELESEQARAEDLTKRLAERDLEIEKLRKAAAERETLASKVAALTDKLERAKQRVTALTDELAGRGRPDNGGGLEARPQPESVKPEESGLRPATGRQDRELVLRLAAAQAELTRSFETDVAKGDVLVQHDRGRLTISLADRLLFDNGQRAMRTDGRRALRKLGEVFKTVPDKFVRVESRLEESANGAKKDGAGPVGWDLHTARAASVVRVLVEEGGLDAADLSMGVGSEPRNGVGPADDHHIEIILSPKN